MNQPVKKKKRVFGKERRLLADEIRRAIGKSKTDSEIIQDLGIHPALLAEIKKEILAVDASIYTNLSSVAVFQDFVEKSRDNIRQIDQFFTKFKNRGQWSSLVAGIKVKQEIHKDVVKLGQDLGFIDKKSGELKVTGEIGFSTMAENEVMEEVRKEVEGIRKMLKRQPVGMRSEVLEAAGSEINKHLPALEYKGKQSDVIDAEFVESKPTRKKVKTKIKVQLKKRI